MKQLIAWGAAALLLAAPLATLAQNVGIGTTAPTQTLDVNGSLRVRGLTGDGTRLPTVQPDGTLGASAPYASGVAVPALPTAATGSVATGSYSYAVATSGSLAYVVSYGPSSTLQVFDVSSPAAPVLRGAVGTGSYSADVAVSGNLAFVVNSNDNSLQVFDVSSPTTPVLRSTTTTGSRPSGIAVSGSLAYVTNYGSGSLQVFNVSDPAAPVLKGTVAAGGYPTDVAVSGSLAYVLSNSTNTLQAFDVSDPTAPVLKGSAATGSFPVDVVVSGNLAYVVNTSSYSLQVFDVGTAGAPVLRGTAATGITPAGVAVSGSLACVVNSNSNTLQVFDVSAPGAPVLKSTAPTGGYPNGIAVGGNLACVVNGNGSLQVFTVVPPPRAVAVSPDGTLGSVALPSGTDFIQNSTSPQAGASFNVGGTGTIGGNALVGGSLGIGTSTPAYKLDVAGTANLGGNTSIGGNATVSGAGTIGGNALVGGSLGIGTTAPAQLLDVEGSAAPASAGTAPLLRLGRPDNSGVRYASSLEVNVGTYGTSGNLAAQTQVDLRLGQGSTANPDVTVLSLRGNGNVGLGTTAPATRLDVQGNVRLALRTCPVNTGAAYTLTAADIAYSIFRLQNGAYASPLTLPAAAAGQVEGQELTIVNVAEAGTSISGTNTDNAAAVALPGSATAGLHAARYVWVIPTVGSGAATGTGYWVRVP